MNNIDGKINLSIKNHIAEVMIDRPQKHNALTPEMYKQIFEICHQINFNKDVKVVLFYGAGEKAFCAGTDINMLKNYEDFWEWRNRLDYIEPIRHLKKPSISAIKGWALGGGFEIALACDLRIASQTAVFGAPEVTLGWVGAGGAAQHLTRLSGYGQAMKLLLTGERIDAKEAYRIGVIEWLVDANEELSKARTIAKQIASYSTVATQTVKSAVRSAMNGNLESGFQIENELMSLCLAKAQNDSSSPFKKNKKG